MSELTGALRETLHEKENIISELEELAKAVNVDYQAEIARLTGKYQESGGLPPEFAELLDKRFAEAVKAANAGESLFLARKEKMEKLSGETDALLAAGELATLKEVELLEKNILEIDQQSELLARIAPLKAQLLADEAAVKAAEEAVLKLAAELEELCAAGDITPLHDRKPGIEAEFAQLANIPRHAALRYNEAHRKASVTLAQHYETLDLARWENYTRKLDLCAALEKMLEWSDDELSGGSKKLNELREQWKKLGSVPKEKNEEINPRYLELTRKVQHKIDEFFARKRQMQKIASSEKETLCIEAETMADSTDWKDTAVKMRDLQAKWKLLPRAGAKENELYQRFRAAQDKFFNARKAVFDEREKRFAASAEVKNALIAEAENLSDPRRARQLREEFRNAGFAGKADQALYEKFNAAMDNFFNARKAENASKEERVKELISEITSLTADPAVALPRIREIREELRQCNIRNARQSAEAALKAFDNALNELRRNEQRRKEENSDTMAMKLADAYQAWKDGAETTVPDAGEFAGFNKLQTMAKMLAQAVAGDNKAAAKLDRQIENARSERLRICEAMESLGGKAPEKAAVQDLAAELQFAMLGDFGKNSAPSAAATADPQELCAQFAACGIVPPEELIELQQRFAAAKAVLKL